MPVVMPPGENEPPTGSPARTESGEAAELPLTGSDPGDDYFDSGSFSPVTVQLEDEPTAPEAEAAPEAPRRAPDPDLDDSPEIIVQLGEDPGVVSREDPDDA